MKEKLVIAIPYIKDSRYSYNVLLGSLESSINKMPKIFISEVNIDKLKEMQNFVGLINDLRNKYKQVLVPISFKTTELDQIIPFINMLKKIKSKSVLIVGGGPHPSGDPLGTLKLGFDLVFIGEAEDSFSTFIHQLMFNKNKDSKDMLTNVRGVAWVEDDTLYFKPRTRFVDLNKYLPFSLKFNLFNPIEITRGCNGGCYFCQVPLIFGACLRHRDVSNIVKYSELMLKRGLKDIRFISPNSLSYGGNGKEVKTEIIEELLSKLYELTAKFKGRIFFGTFPSEVRPELVNDEVIKVLSRYVSNKRIIIGAQSGSNRVLKAINRGHAIEDVFNATEIILKHGFGVDVDFILGLPFEDEEDIELTINAMFKLISMGDVRIHLHYYMPLPGTPLFKLGTKDVPKKYIKKIFKILGKGKAYGYWLKQRELSCMIMKYYQKGIIKTRDTYHLRVI